MLYRNTYFFSKIFYKIISRISINGKNLKLDFFFEYFLLNLKKKKNCFIFFFFLEALFILRSEVGVKILKYSKNKNVKKRKKGKGLPVKTKVIPILLPVKSRLNLVLNWILLNKNSGEKKTTFFGVLPEIIKILNLQNNSSIKEKKNLRKLILVNRGFIHYRW